MKNHIAANAMRRAAVFTVALFLFSAPLSISFAQISFKDAPDVNIEEQRKIVDNFVQPIDEYNSFSGTYGELRGNHFHCGLDMRTGGVVGKKIYAADDGYVSRITVTPGGFGNMIMITHPSGYKSIYGHLLKFAPKYQSYVRERQYAGKSWVQSLDFEPGMFPVRKGDLIAYSGNSGSSGGPHLHFEVRDPKGNPVNLLMTRPFGITDTQRPYFRGVKFYGAALMHGVYHTYPIEIKTPMKTIRAKKGKRYVTKKVPDENAKQVVQLPKSSYVAVDAYDRMEGTTAKLAVYQYEVFLDTTSIFRFTEGNIPYSTGRYIASMLQHSERVGSGRYYLKSFVSPGNKLQDRISHKDNGLIVLSDTLFHTVKIVCTDVYGNAEEKSYIVKRNDALYSREFRFSAEGKFFGWADTNSFRTTGFSLTVPSGALYSSLYFSADTTVYRSTPYSPTWKIGDEDVPLHAACDVSMKVSVPEELRDKVILARVRKNGTLASAGGSYDAATSLLSGKISSFGKYCAAIDTVPPVATFRFAENAAVRGSSVKIVIGDKLSGVRNYSVEIDGHWVVAEFDGKTATLEVPLYDAKISKGRQHTMVVRLSDMAGNKKEFTRKFAW